MSPGADSENQTVRPSTFAAARAAAPAIGAMFSLTLLVGACGSPPDEMAFESSTSSSTEVTTFSESTVPGTNVDEVDGGDGQAAALAAARQRWAEADLGDHTLLVQDHCGECDPADRAVGEVVSWGEDTYASGPSLTVESMFARIEKALADGRTVEATYDDASGYPTEVLIDPEEAEVDGGSHVVIHEVRPGLPGDAFSTDGFAQAVERWRSSRPPAYEYTVTIACGRCPYEGRLWARVIGDQVVDERFASAGGDESAEAVTIDEVFSDLQRLFESDGGLVESGVLINGTAAYHPEYGYPNWIGLDLEIVEPRESNRNLPARLVYMIGGFTAIDTEGNDYCVALDQLFSMTPAATPDAAYLQQLAAVHNQSPVQHRVLWELFNKLLSEPFDYDNFNPAADALDATASDLTDACPNLGPFVMDDGGYIIYLR